MELKEFRATAYKLLTEKGYIEKDGEMYYPESAVMEMLEWMFAEVQMAKVEEFDTLVAETLDRAFTKLREIYPGHGGTKPD